MVDPTQKILIISGPTASGKSGLALQIAQDHNGIIINADALQVYGEMRILTARPSLEEEKHVPHHLYGHRSIRQPYAVTDWLQEIRPVLEQAWQDGQHPIIVGGTGFYLHSLLHGLAPVPDVPDEIRNAAMALYDSIGHDLFRNKLREIDPALAKSIKQNDRQRLVRAWEVYQATGQPLSYWQQQDRQVMFPQLHSQALLLKPPRDILHQRIDARFLQMIDQGALDEARQIEKINPDPALPGCKALGLTPLRHYLRGELALDEAIIQGQATSRQYAKRQMTWINTQWRETERHKIALWDTQTDIKTVMDKIIHN